MHATQPQGADSPEPHHTEPANHLVGLFTDDTRFRTWIAQALATAAQPPATPEQPDLKAMSQEEFYRWSQGASPTGAPHAPSPDDRYVVTEPGLEALDEAAPGEAPGTAAQVLRDAALYLSRHGWIQGAYYDATATSYTPAACMVGAIGMVCYGGPVDAPAQQFDDPGFLDFEEAVLHLDRYLLVEDGSESYEFNDARGRQVETVTDVLRQAAARPAEELLDALRVIDAKSAEVAAIAELLKPCGIWAEPVTAVKAPRSVARVLRDAALYLEQHGWTQKSFYDKASESLTPRACMVGSIAMVCYGKPVDDPTTSADEPGFAELTAALAHLNDYIDVHYNQFGYHDAMSLNDAGSREALNVILVLREAADAADGGDA